MDQRRVYHIGAIAAQFQPKVVFIREFLYSKKSTKTTIVEEFTYKNHLRLNLCSNIIALI